MAGLQQNSCLRMQYPTGFFIQFIYNRDSVCLYLTDRADASTIVGAISGRVECSNGRAVGHIYTLAVADAYRRRGVGSTLVRMFEGYVIRQASDTGVEAFALKLETVLTNIGARAFYDRLGFACAGTQSGACGWGASGVELLRPVSVGQA